MFDDHSHEWETKKKMEKIWIKYCETFNIKPPERNKSWRFLINFVSSDNYSVGEKFVSPLQTISFFYFYLYNITFYVDTTHLYNYKTNDWYTNPIIPQIEKEGNEKINENINQYNLSVYQYNSLPYDTSDWIELSDDAFVKYMLTTLREKCSTEKNFTALCVFAAGCMNVTLGEAIETDEEKNGATNRLFRTFFTFRLSDLIALMQDKEFFEIAEHNHWFESVNIPQIFQSQPFVETTSKESKKHKK